MTGPAQAGLGDISLRLQQRVVSLALSGGPARCKSLGLCLWSGAEEPEGKADIMGMYLMGGYLAVSC